jgi:glycosyltransferase involved in cell wall biosynthesis
MGASLRNIEPRIKFMKLLIFAQRVDLDDPVLSFFHRWIIELAKHFEMVTVICLFEGAHDLPANVKVHSLGKESGSSRSKYLFRFFKYIFIFRKEYDAVFIHQNQEYAILGGIFWKFMGMKAYMWRNHYAGSLLTDLAAAFCTRVFCTSKFSFTAKYRKTVLMPVGIDMETFSPEVGVGRRENSVLSLGRIAPSKKLDQFIEALGILNKEKIDFNASIVGDALPGDAAYHESLKSKANVLGIEDRVSFKPGVSNDKTPSIYSAHGIFVNLSPSGMFDKTIFEAMACGTLAISCNKDLIDKIDLDYLFKEDDVNDLASKVGNLLALSSDERNARGEFLRRFVEENHGLARLGSRLAEEML